MSDAGTQSNHEHWEALARFHGTGDDDYYDLELLRSGGSLMGVEERDAIAFATDGRGLAGTSVLHLQCHIGCDSIAMAREGATVTSVDFSRTALDRLEALARECGVAVATVEADATRLPHELAGQFDYVYASIGVLCWIEDLDGWMAGVRRSLRGGGALILVELHPLVTMVESLDPLVVDFPYAFDGPHVYSGTGTYANRDAAIEWTTVQYAHSVGEVVTAATRAGLRCELLIEHTSGSFNTGQFEGPEDDGRYRLRLGRGAARDGGREPACPMPVLYTLVAKADAAPDEGAA
ncbi:MAG TPA: class I SAM-dependent methyltransferase [Acidimicrobiales bacterium]|jgi:SAM-dependent methyltransferase|nr:class I SAM-dependent methyltransferase [Acidimicrobiales bacterium]